MDISRISESNLLVVVCKRAFRSWSSSLPLQRVCKIFCREINVESGLSGLITFKHRAVCLTGERCTSHRIWLEFRPDQLLHSSLQAGAVLCCPAPRASPRPGRPQVDPIVRAGQGGAGRAPVHVRRVQRVHDVDTRGGRQAAGPGWRDAGDGFKSLNAAPEALHFLTCQEDQIQCVCVCTCVCVCGPTVVLRAMSPKRRPRRSSRLSSRPSSHFHQLQQEQRPEPEPSVQISDKQRRVDRLVCF